MVQYPQSGYYATRMSLLRGDALKFHGVPSETAHTDDTAVFVFSFAATPELRKKDTCMPFVQRSADQAHARCHGRQQGLIEQKYSGSAAKVEYDEHKGRAPASGF